MASTPTRKRIDPDDLAIKCEASLKVGYQTRQQALDGAERAMDAGRVSPGCHLTPYLCDDCGEYHVHNRRIVDVPSDDASRRQTPRRPRTDTR